MFGLRAALIGFATVLVATPLKAQDEAEAMSAAPDEVAANATIVDSEGNVLREGNNGYTCMPTPSDLVAPQPMCLDETWMAWADAWKNKKELNITKPGLAYMLGGDAGVSNSDPYGFDPDEASDWVSAEQHLMLLLPDAAGYEAFPSDPSYGGPWVMWKGTPYAHVMIPISEVVYQGEN